MKVICIGNSHIGALSVAGVEDWAQGRRRPYDLFAGRLGHSNYAPVVDGQGRLNAQLVEDLAHARRGEPTPRVHLIGAGSDEGDRDVLVSMVGGNAHNLLALVQPPRPFDFVLRDRPDLPLDSGSERLTEAEVAAVLSAAVEGEIAPILRAIARSVGGEIWHLESPPPIRSNDHIARHLEARFQGRPGGARVSSPALRYKLWRLHSAAVRRCCDELGIRFVEHPAETVDADGFLLEQHVPANATHAAPSYGRLQLDQIERLLTAARPAAPGGNPYRRLPDSSFWSRAVARPAMSEVRPLRDFPFRITAADKVATAGSCFAQHIARHLAGSGFHYHVVEQGHPMLGANLRRKFNYGTFSARYANIYTSRQLLQLIERAEGRFTPLVDWWDGPEGGVVDPFRPTIQPGGFASVAELQADRDSHLAAVRRMLREMDVFVFTLGLTETWVDRRDGAAFPLCPGVSGGRFDPSEHAFLNLRVDEVRDDLRRVVTRLRDIRPDLRIILTVSPVPLKATASEDHVLSATTYSKSVLRVAAHDIAAEFGDVGYFPSFEIITGNFNRGAYYDDDLREVRPEGVAHVMRTFFETVTEGQRSAADNGGSVSPAAAGPAAPGSARIPLPETSTARRDAEAAQVECEEELLEFDRVMAASAGDR